MKATFKIMIKPSSYTRYDDPRQIDRELEVELPDTIPNAVIESLALALIAMATDARDEYLKACKAKENEEAEA